MAEVEINFFGELIGNTTFFGIEGLVGLVLAVLFVFAITNDLNRIAGLFFPVLVALLIAGVPQNVFVMAIASIIWITDSLNVKIYGNYLDKRSSQKVTLGDLFGGSK